MHRTLTLCPPPRSIDSSFDLSQRNPIHVKSFPSFELLSLQKIWEWTWRHSASLQSCTPVLTMCLFCSHIHISQEQKSVSMLKHKNTVTLHPFSKKWDEFELNNPPIFDIILFSIIAYIIFLKFKLNILDIQYYTFSNAIC